nr:iron-sulfur cluster biosynthesis family protein [Caldalkalibacillus salinus]
MDETRKNDTILKVEHIPFYIDRFTQRYVDQEVVLDFDPVSGFKLSNDAEILSHGLTIYQEK